MSARPETTRYAPSPTGPLHLGHARTHLVAYLEARATGGRIVMRLEDLDRPRVRPGAEAEILRDHAYLGLDWDEGPLRQSERLPLYGAALGRLLAAGLAYPCTCSRKEIAEAASAPHGDDGPPYPGTCRLGPKRPGAPAAYRFRMPEAPIVFEERAATVTPGHPSDFVLQRADGVFAYHLAVVVDDAASGVTLVVRGDDLLGSAPRHAALHRALGHEPPAFQHVPLVLGADGQRLAKRTGAPPIAALREAGVPRETLLATLGRSLGLVEPGESAIDLPTLVERRRTRPLRYGVLESS